MILIEIIYIYISVKLVAPASSRATAAYGLGFQSLTFFALNLAQPKGRFFDAFIHA